MGLKLGGGGRGGEIGMKRTGEKYCSKEEWKKKYELEGEGSWEGVRNGNEVKGERMESW